MKLSNELLKKWTVSLMIVVTSTQLTACTDEEVATAIGVGAIVGGAIIIGNNTRCQGGYETRCHDFRDRFGRIHSECRSVYDSCAYLVPKAETFASIMQEGVSQAKTDAAQLISDTVTDLNWGIQFGLSFEASDKFIASMKDAKSGKLDAVLNLGLSKDDAKLLAQFKTPSQAGIEAVSQNLDADHAAVEKMFTELTKTAKENKNKLKSKQTASLGGKKMESVQ